MFSKYDYEDLKLTKKYLEETEGFNVYYFNEFMNSNLELIISGYIVLRRKWYSKELYEIEFEYNYNKKEFELIFPSEFNNLFDRWKLTENNTIFTKDELLKKTQNYIDDIIRETVLGYIKI